MTTEELRTELVADLTIELSGEENFNATLLDSKVKNAIRDVKAARKYPSTYPESLIERDLENFYTTIRAVALLDYTKIGAEGQNNYSADGESISYVDRNSLFAGVNPICGVF